MKKLCLCLLLCLLVVSAQADEIFGGAFPSEAGYMADDGTQIYHDRKTNTLSVISAESEYSIVLPQECKEIWQMDYTDPETFIIICRVDAGYAVLPIQDGAMQPAVALPENAAIIHRPLGEHVYYHTKEGHRLCRFNWKTGEETELLTEGRGSLYELYKDVVLPPTWKAPRMRPLAFANHLGLLHSNTLAVHGTQLDRQEAQILAANGTMLCLCPRSNANLGVGLPDVHGLMEENVLLCLGTDGLSSNTDVDVCNEALFLRKKMDISPNALIRMLTVNGASALGDAHGGKLSGRASFCALPDELIHGCTFA